jgi:hypothetical protein
MVWLESPYITQEMLAAVLSDAETQSNRSAKELDAFFLNLNFDLGISKAVQALESY